MQMWAFLRANGGEIIKRYIEAILKVPPRQVAEQFTDVIVCLCVEFRLQDNLAKTWLTQALQEVPITVFTEENK